MWNGMHKIVVHGQVTDQNTGREGKYRAECSGQGTTNILKSFLKEQGAMDK